MPKLSVIMSVYNEPPEWLHIAIQSILDQSYSDFEFIIINDNPEKPDNDRILREFSEKDNRVVIITNAKNIGLTKSLNQGLKVAKGEYIARMDADDMSLPLRFERQVTFLDNHPEILCVGSWTTSIDQNGNRLNNVCRYESDYRWVRAQFIQNSQISHPTAMFHRIINNELVQYDETVRYAQDYSLMVSIMQYGEITNLPEVLFCYRNSDSQITSSRKIEQQACAFKAQKRVFSLFKLNTSSQFLELYHRLTIRHDVNISFEFVSEKFREFFHDNKINRKNSLALELLYSTFLAYIRSNNTYRREKALITALKSSTPTMMHLGLRLFYHLLIRKINRKKG